MEFSIITIVLTKHALDYSTYLEVEVGRHLAFGHDDGAQYSAETRCPVASHPNACSEIQASDVTMVVPVPH